MQKKRHEAAFGVLKKAVVLSAIPLILLCGCEKDEDPAAGSVTESGNMANWKEDGFVVNDMSAGKPEERLLNIQGFQKWDAEPDDKTEWGVIDSGTVGNSLWRLRLSLDEEGVLSTGRAARYIYEKYDADSGKTENTLFTPEDFGLDDETGYMEGMSVGADGFCILRWVSYAVDADGLYIQTTDQMILTDFGNNCKILDFYDLFLEKGIETVFPCALPMWNSLQCRMDKNGNIYVLSGDNLYVFDSDQQQLMEFRSSSQEQLLQLVRTDAGEYIAITDDMSRGNYRFLWIDSEHGTLKELCVLDDSAERIDKVLGMWENAVFYIGRDNATAGNAGKLVKWNIATGEKEIVMDFASAGIDSANFSVELMHDDGSDLWLCLCGGSGLNSSIWFSGLTAEAVESVGNIVVADLTGNGEFLSRCALRAQMSSPNFRFDCMDASDQTEKEKIELELVQQNGPDILCISYKDMYNYAKKGLLSDMSEMVGGELMEEILPGAIEIGTIDGKLYGLPSGVVAKTFVAAENRNIPEAWDMEDLSELMQSGDLSGTIGSPYAFGGVLPASLALQELISYNLEASFLVDSGKHTCHFDGEEFVQLLDVVRNAGNSFDSEEWFKNPADMCWGYLISYGNFISFFDHIEYEHGKIVGYPTGDGCEGYLVPSGGMVVVNRNTKSAEAVREFLKIMLGEEMQERTGRDCLSVRKITPSDYYTEDDSGKLYFMGNKSIEVTLFDDGTNSMVRAAAFLNNCGGLLREDRTISGIVYEEVCSMLESGRTSEETAGIINNRVQLYLDEL